MTSSNVRVAAPRAGQTSRPAAVTGRLSDVWQQVRQNLKTQRPKPQRRNVYDVEN